VASRGHTSASHYARLKDICGVSVRPSGLPVVWRPAGSAARPRRRAVFGCCAGTTGEPDNHHHLGQGFETRVPHGNARDLAESIIQGAIENFSQEFAAIIERFLKLKKWKDTERIVIGGGFRAVPSLDGAVPTKSSRAHLGTDQT
jgi:hypothetical protein